jgi:hypothetical protein
LKLTAPQLQEPLRTDMVQRGFRVRPNVRAKLPAEAGTVSPD